MCKNPNSPYVVGLPKNGRQALVFKTNCDEWECEECARNKQAQWSARGILGLQEMKLRGMDALFVTITTAEWYKTAAEARVNFPRAWNKLYNRLKRKNPQFDVFICTIDVRAEVWARCTLHFFDQRDPE